MKPTIGSLSSRLSGQFRLFAFAGLWTLLVPGRTVHADPIELQASLVQESATPCNQFLLQGPNFFFNSQVEGFCSGNSLAYPGETLFSYVSIGPSSPFQGPPVGDISVPENPGRSAILTGGIGAAGPPVTVPLDATGVFRLESPVFLTGTLSACLLPANDTLYPPCDPNYLDFANINASVFGFDVFKFDCFEPFFCFYDESFTGAAVPEPVNMAAIGLAGLATLFVFGRRRIAS